MPTKRYRCLSCVNDKGIPGRDFTAERPACPNCGADPAKDPRHAQLIAELEDIHFDAPSRHPGMGVGFLACDPARKVVTAAGVRATGHPAAVTCPKCLGTTSYKAEAERMGVPTVLPEADREVAVDPATMTIAPAE